MMLILNQYSLYIWSYFWSNIKHAKRTPYLLERREYCVLIILSPRWSIATYFDSGCLSIKKDYERIKGVLNDALEGYAQKVGHFEKGGKFKGECLTADNKHRFRHGTEFDCLKQDASSTNKEAFYALHYMKAFVEDREITRLPSSFREWTKYTTKIPDAKLREDFHCIQVQFPKIIYEDVVTQGGPSTRAMVG